MRVWGFENSKSNLNTCVYYYSSGIVLVEAGLKFAPSSTLVDLFP